MKQATKLSLISVVAYTLLCASAWAGLTDGLTFYCPLDTTDAVDLAGGNNGALSGGVVITDDTTRGNVFDFSGSDAAKVAFAGVPTAGTGSITVSLWFNSLNADVVASGSQFIATHGNASGSDQEGWSMWLSSASVNEGATGAPDARANILTEVEGVDTKQKIGTNYGAWTSDSNWHHMLMTIDNTTGHLTSYIDGVGSGVTGSENGWNAGGGGAASTVDFTPDELGSDGEDLVLGVMFTYTHRSFAGLVDDVAIWDRVLTATEIADVYAGASLVPNKLPAGDANGDGKVDGSDVTILAGSWQVGVDGLQEATWAMGDFNGDKKVDGSDVTILAGNWQYGVGAAASAVPEPSCVLLILSTIVGLLIWRRAK